VIEDALLYQLPENDFHQLREQNPDFDQHFRREDSRKIRPDRPLQPQQLDPLLLQSVADLMHRNPVCLKPEQTARDAATCMDRHHISSVLIADHRELLGIVTDRDLRSRVIAADRSGDITLAAIMTTGLKTLSPGDSLFDAMLLMTEYNLHHLPVVDQQHLPLGILSATDLLHARSNNPIFLAQRIKHCSDVNGLREIVSRLPRLMGQWHSGGASGLQISRMLTTVSDAVTRRLLVLAEAELGPPPAAYAWLGFGSQGRSEQALGADQANALVYSSDKDAGDRDADDRDAGAASYFEALAERVCNQLDYCGYSLCRGDIMAKNPRWRLPLDQWRQTVQRWTAAPTPKAVMHVSIFFDIRAIHGDATLARALQATMLDCTAGNDIFSAALAQNALEHRPPLGFFRRFVVEHSGEHQSALDLKLRGIIPIVDLCRIHALAQGISAVNTSERIHRLLDQGVLTPVDGGNLLDAFEFICQQRIALQVRQVAGHRPADNFLDPTELNHLAREQLRDAFSVVHEAQQALQLKYLRGGLF